MLSSLRQNSRKNILKASQELARLHSSQAAGYKIAKAFLREESHWDP